LSNDEQASSNTAQPGDRPLLECAIVMAGGVTSGIIYPGAVAMIARRYSFRSVGGTSVGAIAAAVTAAAEYGRRSGRNPNGFAEVAALPKSLGEVARDGHTRLFHLFRPQAKTKPLFALIAPLFGSGGALSKSIGVGRATLSLWYIVLPVIVTALAGIALFAALSHPRHFGVSVIAVFAGVSLVLIVWLATLAFFLWRYWLPAWQLNGYGICTGNPAKENGQEPDREEWEELTPWMHRIVQSAAGRGIADPPLTFGDLWSAPAGMGEPFGTVGPAAPRSIELEMIASDISRNRTTQLPFLETPSPIYVKTAVLRRYFPRVVADWMIDHKGDYDEGTEKPDGMIRLPKPQDLPVVFGARLSLSFPVLLCAFPLMTPDVTRRPAAGGRVPLRPLWLSDGGLTSNFPIHFFDSPIPARPTFCLNLVDFDAGTSNIEGPKGDAAKPIALPSTEARTAAARPKTVPTGDPQPGDPVWGLISMSKGNRFTPPAFTSFDSPGTGVISFFVNVVNTARSWSDNQLLIAPGVRDRVADIALRADEGGLNLDMDANVIADLDLRGRAAGLLISARFDPSATVDPETGGANAEVFANHRWVRFRNFMAAFEDISRRFALSRRSSDDAARIRGESLLGTMIAGGAKEKLGYYPLPIPARAFCEDSTNGFEALALDMANKTRNDPEATFDPPHEFGLGHKGTPGAAPRPKMRFQLRPLANNDPRAEEADLPPAR
jgi:predicted acylesterase/phospholipase RssA